MDTVKLNVLETYNLKFCCVCTQNGEALYLNIYENVIIFQDVYISLAQIISETLNFSAQQNTNRLLEICINCKTKIVDFFIFKRRAEEARNIFIESLAVETPVKDMLLEVVDRIDSRLSSKESPDYEETELSNAEKTLNDETLEEEFLDSDSVQDLEETNYGDDFSSIEQHSDKEEAFISTEIVDFTEGIDECGEVNFESVACEQDITDEASSSSKRKSFRQANPEGWIRNKRKLAKNTGQSYVASNGKIVEAKQMKSSCSESCRMHCSRKISEDNRLKIFKHFYQLADIAKQRRYLFDHMKTYEPQRSKSPKNPKKARAVQRCYFLDLREKGTSEQVQVCKLMFLNTFSISSQMIDTLYRKAISEGKFNDTRGRFERKQRTYLSEKSPERAACETCDLYVKATGKEKSQMRKAYNRHFTNNKTCSRLRSRKKILEKPDMDLEKTG